MQLFFSNVWCLEKHENANKYLKRSGSKHLMDRLELKEENCTKYYHIYNNRIFYFR